MSTKLNLECLEDRTLLDAGAAVLPAPGFTVTNIENQVPVLLARTQLIVNVVFQASQQFAANPTPQGVQLIEGLSGLANAYFFSALPSTPTPLTSPIQFVETVTTLAELAPEMFGILGNVQSGIDTLHVEGINV